MPENRFIIGGFSPHVFELPPELFRTGKVIAINEWPLNFPQYPFDYWIALDTFRWAEWKDWMREIDAIKAMRAPRSEQELAMGIPDDAADLWFTQAPKNTFPTEWNGTLQWVSSTALAAINLAIVLGASEVVLAGVDFVGQGRADGSEYHKPDFWEYHKGGINNLIRQYQQAVPIYKTHPNSWLECSLLEV